MGLFDKLSRRPSQDTFAQTLMDCIRRAGETRTILYDHEQFRLFIEGEHGTRLFLGNAFQEYTAAATDDRAMMLQKIARCWFIGEKRIPEEYEDAKPDLLPVVRPRAYYENARLQMQLDGQRDDSEWPQQIVADDLAVTLVYDLPDAMRSVGQEDLDRWGTTFYEALEVARENLSHLPHAFIGPKEGAGVYLSATNDNYDASRLLLLDTIRQFQVKGGYVAMIPNRDVLIVTGAEDVDGLKAMVSLAKDALSKPRSISGLTMRLDGDEWISWMPDTAHPLYQEFRMFQVQSHGQDYREQKDLLDRLHEKSDQDIFVASFLAAQHKETGQITTHSVWAKNVLSLLPVTDRIAFVQDGSEPVMAAWDRMVEVVGDLLTPMDIYPERFRVSEFPSKGQLAAMGAENV